MDRPQPARILIVEDEPIIALTLEDLLIDAGFEVARVTGRLHRHSSSSKAPVAMRPSSTPI